MADSCLEEGQYLLLGVGVEGGREVCVQERVGMEEYQDG